VIADGETYLYDAKYSVTESSATIAPVLMKFLYESIPNDLEIAMPGIPSGAVSARLQGAGSIVFKDKNIWSVSGLSVASENVEVVLTANVGGRTVSESKQFKVRSLPDPQAFIAYKDAEGRTRKFHSGSLSKRSLIEAPGINAAIDDGVLLVPYTVTSFTLRRFDNRGMSIPEISNSANFTPQQKDIIRNMSTGVRFYISDVKALDPQGKPISLKYSMDILVTN
jgi:gliding motility-associated protein GldM